MNITNSTLADLPEIFRLYDLATEYQRKKFPENEWPTFDRDFIKTEIEENRQFKIMIDGEVACIWAITYNDAEIWEEKENDDAVYLHRIATNPEFRGNNFVQIISDWATKFAKSKGRKYVRMDTCGNNEVLINHYKSCGFEFLGMKKLKDSSGLQKHYQDADVCYFEREVE